MDYSQFPSLKITKTDGVAVMAFNHPERRNAFGGTMHREVEDIFLVLADDPEVNIIVVTGEGKAFSAGGNIKNMAARWGSEEGWKHLLGSPHRTTRIVGNILKCPKVTIAAINGDAMGLGASIALCCDLQVIAESARIADTHVRVGLVAGDGGTVIWPLLIGPQRAKEYLMRAKVLNGVEAEKLGLVNYCVPAAEVMAKALEIAEELNALPPLAVRWTKATASKHVIAQFNLVAEAAIALEDLTMLSHDHREALAAMVEKRKPRFQGI